MNVNIISSNIWCSIVKSFAKSLSYINQPFKPSLSKGIAQDGAAWVNIISTLVFKSFKSLIKLGLITGNSFSQYNCFLFLDFWGYWVILQNVKRKNVRFLYCKCKIDMI